MPVKSKKQPSEIMLMRVIRSAEILFKGHEKPSTTVAAQHKLGFEQKTQK
jgi:hypothetical protein